MKTMFKVLKTFTSKKEKKLKDIFYDKEKQALIACDTYNLLIVELKEPLNIKKFKGIKEYTKDDPHFYKFIPKKDIYVEVENLPPIDVIYNAGVLLKSDIILLFKEQIKELNEIWEDFTSIQLYGSVLLRDKIMYNLPICLEWGYKGNKVIFVKATNLRRKNYIFEEKILNNKEVK